MLTVWHSSTYLISVRLLRKLYFYKYVRIKLDLVVESKEVPRHM